MKNKFWGLSAVVLLLGLSSGAYTQVEKSEDLPSGMEISESQPDESYVVLEGKRQRDNWYIGFGILPAATFKINGSTPFDSSQDRPLLMDFSVGGTINPNLLVGFHMNSTSQTTKRYGLEGSYSVTGIGAQALYFPQSTGAFVRAGLYTSQASYEVKFEDDTRTLQSESEAGYGFGIGGGYAFWLATTFNLVLDWQYYQHQFPGKGYDNDTIDFKNSKTNAFGLGFYWF